MIRLEDVRFRYGRDGFQLRVPALRIETGRRTAIVGPSGCGKTTLLALLAGIRVPESGRVFMDDVEISSQTDAERRRFRSAHVGLIFQEFELLEYLNVRDNVLLPYRLHPALVLDASVRERADKLLNAVGLASKRQARIDRLSQGERQRVAICRALVTRPQYLLADEPTGNLDPSLKDQILTILFERQADVQATLIMVTHDHSLLNRFDTVLPLDSVAEGITTP